MCAHCGKLQPPLEGENYFSALGAPAKFSQDLPALEKRFYELSRALHPDRFSAGGQSQAEAQRYSLERMSLINQAYRTLKNRGELRGYLLGLHGIEAPKGTAVQMPVEMAEVWFELQDLMMEDPAQARQKLSEFEKQLQDALESEEKELRLLESSYDESLSRETLQKISKHIQTQSYLKSLERDVQRLKNNQV